ncbi:hypothetical protein CAEBREN_19473 [Caenorhabditis brenneri]|uniref:Uncharacterized protein n=1 Tax=Caenorhabditis brenneri TaxID=135651 RepID=G0NMY4_CAEBE|nr:hypothetical protein CAEBREN_19473 [Caenorhabditis brenneri]
MGSKKAPTTLTEPTIKSIPIRNILFSISVFGIIVSLIYLFGIKTPVSPTLFLINFILLSYGSIQYEVLVLRSCQFITILLLILVVLRLVMELIFFVVESISRGRLIVCVGYCFGRNTVLEDVFLLFIAAVLPIIYSLTKRLRLYAIERSKSEPNAPSIAAKKFHRTCMKV